MINTTGQAGIADSFSLRREALMDGVPYYTTVRAAQMPVAALEALRRGELEVKPLQDYLKLTRRHP